MKVLLIRHYATKGNLEKRYIGRTDEPILVREIVRKFKQDRYDGLFVSPMKRCIESADLLFPSMKKRFIEEFKECDFGLFEGKNYLELNQSTELAPLYQKWIDSEGRLPFPKGDDPVAYQLRVKKKWIEVLTNSKEEGMSQIVLILHGGSIMAIMHPLQIKVENGEAIELEMENKNGEWEIRAWRRCV